MNGRRGRGTGPAQVLAVLALLLVGAGDAAGQEEGEAGAADDYARASRGTRILEGGSGLRIKMLLEASNLGGDEVELGEITFPVGTGARGGGHRHGVLEIFYLLSGEMDHVVNGETHRLTPGMVGVVRAGDEVVHRVVGDEPVRALVIWAPGGEAARIAPNLTERPVEGGGG